VGTAEDLLPGQAASLTKSLGCSVIVNASLEALAPDSTSPSCRNFERRCLRLSGTAEDLITRPRHSKKYHEERFVIVNASLAGVAPVSAYNELGIFERRCFALEWAPEGHSVEPGIIEK
jgi:hypothetical protein